MAERTGHRRDSSEPIGRTGDTPDRALSFASSPSTIAIGPPDGRYHRDEQWQTGDTDQPASATPSCRAESTGSATDLCLIEPFPSARFSTALSDRSRRSVPWWPRPSRAGSPIRHSVSTTTTSTSGQVVGRRSGNTRWPRHLCRFYDSLLDCLDRLMQCRLDHEKTACLHPPMEPIASGRNGGVNWGTVGAGICPKWPTLKGSRHASKLNEISQEDTDVRRSQSGIGQGP